MKLGIVLPQRAAGPDELLGAALAAENAGLDSIWVEDHLFGRPDRGRPVGGPGGVAAANRKDLGSPEAANPPNHLEGWTALAAAAAVTQRVTIGTLVLRVGLRNPRVLVSMAQTLDLISDGRLVVGLGIGDASAVVEHRVHGIEFAAKPQRVMELRRTIEMLKEALPETPVWVGGSSEEIFETLPLADGWNFWGPPEGFPEAAERARAAGGPRVEVSWGGMAGQFNPEMLRQAGAGHAIVAVGARNYEERIAFLVGGPGR